jgi:hypothetical protein
MRQMSGGAKWRCGWADRRQVDGALRRPGQRVQHLVAAGDEHEAAAEVFTGYNNILHLDAAE